MLYGEIRSSVRRIRCCGVSICNYIYIHSSVIRFGVSRGSSWCCDGSLVIVA